MKRIAVFLTVLCVVVLSVSVVTAGTYTISTENQIVLQDAVDRAIVPIETDDDGNIIANPVIEGESPVTGLAWSGPLPAHVGDDQQRRRRHR